MFIFVPSIDCNGRHRGEQQCFDPSENLENLKAWARRLKAVPPVVKTCTLLFRRRHTYSYRCEPIFHSYMHRYSRTF